MHTAKQKKPNFLQVTIRYNNNPLSIIGTRIRIEDEDNNSIRETQFMALYDHLRSYEKQRVICAGDFNPMCSWEKYNEYKIKYEKNIYIKGRDGWCYWWIKDRLKNSIFEIITPDKDKEDGSWVDNKNKMFLNDHIIISSNFNVLDAEYIWKFVTRKNGYVTVVNGAEVELEKNRDKSYLKGYPDHAILWAKVVPKTE